MIPPGKRSTKQRLTLADLDNLKLGAGSHDSPEQGMCVLEAVAWFAGREHTDRPPCVSNVIGTFLRSWNDGMNDEDRQQLKRFIPVVVGTASTPEIELQRSWMALDWLCRVSAPAWLRLAGLPVEADAIMATAPIVDGASAEAAQDALNTARSAASNARAAAGDAARDAAWDAAGAAARAAARDHLRPTVVVLQASAMALIERMVALTGGAS